MSKFLRAPLPLVILLAAAAGTNVGTDAPAIQSDRAPVSMALDFLAVARDGRPIPDLRAEEVTLKVGRRTRKVQSLQWVSTADAAPSDASRPLAALPAPYGTNAPDASRAIILVVDTDSFRTGREAPLRLAVDKWLAELPPRDRVALVTVPYGGLKVDFTTDHTKVNRALSTIVGQAWAGETGSQLACRTRATLESLRGLLDSLAGGQGPTPLVFFSSGLAGPRRDAPVATAPGACELTTEHFRQVGVAAAGARAHFYLMQPDDVAIQLGRPDSVANTGFVGSDNPMEGLEHLTGVTGGTQLQLTSTRESGLARVARETSGHYLLAFEPEPSDRNGSTHPIDIRVARNDIVIRARPSIAIPKAGAKARSMSPRDMVADARTHRDLPLRVIGYASQNPGDSKLKILTIAEPADPGVALTGASAGLFDAKGKLVARWTANAEELAGRPLMAALVAPPGAYRLRVSMTDESGRGGSADYQLEAELAPAGPMKLSALVLGLSRGGFKPTLQFGSEPVAIAYFEMYGQPGGEPAVTVELATTMDGPPLLSVPGAVARTNDSARRLATAAIPIGALPPGDYVVRAIAGVAGTPAGRVVRTLRKVAR